jgi:hypothetical protein
VGKTQVHTILKDSEDIYKRWREGNASQIKKKLKSDSSQIDEAVYECNKHTASDIPEQRPTQYSS